MSEENIELQESIEQLAEKPEADGQVVVEKKTRKNKRNEQEADSLASNDPVDVEEAFQLLGAFKVSPSAIIPDFATSLSACIDLSACFEIGEKIKCISQAQTESMRRVTDKGIAIHPNERFLIPTGLIFDIPEGYCLEVYPRSGLSFKAGLSLSNCTGIIDSDYVEQTYVSITNISGTAQYIQKGERIAQAKLVKLVKTKVVELTERPKQKTERNGGFGSTGK